MSWSDKSREAAVYDSDRGISRRQMIALAASGSLSVLAGCSSGGSSDGTGDGSNVQESTLNLINLSPPGELVISPATTIAENEYLKPATTWFGVNQYNPQHEYVPGVIKKSELSDDGSTWRIEVDDRFTWHNGKQVNAWDRFYYEGYFRESSQATQGAATDFEQVEVIDDYTIEYTLKDPVHPGFFFADRVPQIPFGRWLTKEWYEKMKDATTEDEIAKIDSNYADQVSYPIEEHVGHGMWQVEDVSDTTVSYSKYDKHPYAKEQNIEQLERTFKGSQSGARLAWSQGKVDLGLPPRGTQLASDCKRAYHRANEGFKFYLNRNNRHLAKRPIRRAIAYVINSKAIVKNAGGHKTAPPAGGYPIEAQHGLPKTVAEVWIDNYEQFKKKLINYGTTTKQQEASAEMEKAGYRQNDEGKWTDANGKTVSFHLFTVADWMPEQHVKTIASQLRAFGFDVKVTFSTSFWDQFLKNKQPNHDIIPADHGPDEVNYPGPSFDNTWNGMRNHGGDRENHYLGLPWEATVPKNIGDKEVSGSGRKLDLLKLRDEIKSPTLSEKEIKQLTRTFAWYWNYDLPAVYYIDTVAGFAADFENFKWPDYSGDGYPAGKYHGWLGLHTGRVSGKKK